MGRCWGPVEALRAEKLWEREEAKLEERSQAICRIYVVASIVVA